MNTEQIRGIAYPDTHTQIQEFLIWSPRLILSSSAPPRLKVSNTPPHKSSQCYDVQPNSSQRFPLSIRFSVSFQRQNPIYQIIYQIIFQIILENLPTSPIDFDHPKTIHWKRIGKGTEVWPCSVQEIEMPTRPTTTTITSKIQ